MQIIMTQIKRFIIINKNKNKKIEYNSNKKLF